MPETVDRITRRLLELTMEEIKIPLVFGLGMTEATRTAYSELSDQEQLKFNRSVAANVLHEAYLRAKRIGKIPPGARRH